MGLAPLPTLIESLLELAGSGEIDASEAVTLDDVLHRRDLCCGLPQSGIDVLVAHGDLQISGLEVFIAWAEFTGLAVG
jgi:hypothetical protein